MVRLMNDGHGGRHNAEVSVRILFTLLVMLLAAGAPVVAQSPEQQIERSLELAQQRGIPLELLQSKIAEGKAKGVPMARIATAVERRLAALHQARTVTARQALSSAELGVAADAVQAGVSDDVLRTVSGSVPSERRAVAIATLTQLVQLGQPSDVALRNVTEALRKGPEALMRLPAQAAAAAGRRGPPATVPARGGGKGGGAAPAGVPNRGKSGNRPGNSGNNGNNGNNGNPGGGGI